MVACIAGHRAIDEAVTAMVVQLLEQRGIEARTVAHGAVNRETIAALDLAGVTTIMISYLELNGSPARLRYLVRRLRTKAPKARIIVGLWPQGEAALTDVGIQRELGADGYVGSLSAALDAIAEPAASRQVAA